MRIRLRFQPEVDLRLRALRLVGRPRRCGRAQPWMHRDRRPLPVVRLRLLQLLLRGKFRLLRLGGLRCWGADGRGDFMGLGYLRGASSSRRWDIAASKVILDLIGY